MTRTRVCSALLSGALFALLSCAGGAARAGFIGDSVSVDLSVHTTGASDQTVFASDLATIGSPVVELTGVSDPDSPGNQLVWTLDLDDLTITLTAFDLNGAGPVDVGPVHLDVNGLDQMAVQGVSIIYDDFGFNPGDVSFTASSVSLDSLGGLALLGNFGVKQVILQIIVPEPSTLALAGMAAIGLAFAAYRRKRRC